MNPRLTIDELEILTQDQLVELLCSLLFKDSSDLSYIQDLIDVGCPINTIHRISGTPLHFATRNIKAFKFLVSKGAQVNIRDVNGDTPLFWAANSGQLDVVKFIVQNGGDIHIRNTFNLTALHIAADRGNIEVVDFLASSGISINSRNIFGKTPLHYAVEFGHFEVVKFLISKGGNIHARDNHGRSPLHLANLYHPIIANFLINEVPKTHLIVLEDAIILRPRVLL